MSKLLLAAPVLPLTAAAQSLAPAATSPFAACIAASETSLSSQDRIRLEKNIGSLEQALRAVRDFQLPADADPSLRFTPMRSPRKA
jgi:hypothetical protein